MKKTPILCANVNHSARQGQPGWSGSDPLGYVEGSNAQAATIAYICDACAAVLAVEQANHGLRVAAQQAAQQAHLPNPPDPGPPPNPLGV